MGEIAEGLLDGTFDMYTGEYIGEGCGYPRTMEDDYTPQEKKSGVMSYLGGKGFSRGQRRELLLSFYGEQSDQVSNETLCVHASDNWRKFVKFVNKKITQ